MHRLIRSIAVGGLFFICGFFAIAGITFHSSQLNLQQSRDLTNRTANILLQLKTVFSTLKDCETGQRGYVITGDESYLEPYEQCHANVQGMLDKLEQSIDGDAEDKARITRLRQLANNKLEELKQTINLRRNQGFEAARTVIASNSGKVAMDEMRSILSRMEEKQSRLLAQRQQVLKEQFGSSRLYAIILVSTAWLFLVGMIMLIVKLVAIREKELAITHAQYDIAQTLADSPDVNESITLLLGTICESLAWDFGAFWAQDQGAKGLRCITFSQATNLSAPEFLSLTSTIVLPEGQGLPGQTYQSQQPIWLNEVNDLPVRGKSALKEGFHTGLGVPITLVNKKLGVVEFFSKEKRQKDIEVIRLAAAFANQIAQSLERQQAQQLLVEREARLSAILETAADGIISVEKNGKIESANDAACKMFGYEVGALQGMSVAQILPSFYKIIDDYTKKAGSLNPAEFRQNDVETVGIREDSSELPIETSYGRFVLKDKEITTIVVRNISERKEVQRRVNEFYSAVSHELRTPLTSIRGSLSLMDGGRAGELSPRAQQLVKVARTESERLIRLINDILDIKKIESGKLELKYGQIDLSDMLENLTESLSTYAEQNKIKLTWQAEAGTSLNGDRDRIEQILYNLVSNAIKFSPSGETVSISAERKNNCWRIAVKDNGPGIAEADINKLFGLFQQLDPSDSRKKGGTGLGLAICKALVSEHKGHIGIESKLGQGAIFWFEIPDRPDELNDVRAGDRPTLVYKTKSRVLIVEDDRKLASLLAMMLEDQNFIAIKSGSLKEAEEYLQTHAAPDAIILDLTLPDGDGLALMERLEYKNKPVIPIIIVSAREPDMGSYPYPLLIDWIKKPFDEKRLLSALALAIKNRPPGQAKVLIVEDDKPTRDIIKQNLEPLNVKFIEASDGVTAVHYARSQNPDLIVLDLGLPSLDGFEVVQILRKEKVQDTPLIVYTAKDLSEADKKELTLGLTSHLIKSRTSEEELLETVKAMLNGLLDQTAAPV